MKLKDWKFEIGKHVIGANTFSIVMRPLTSQPFTVILAKYHHELFRNKYLPLAPLSPMANVFPKINSEVIHLKYQYLAKSYRVQLTPNRLNV